MLSDKVFRNKVVDNVADPAVKSFWVDEFAKYTERFAAEATPAIQNKVGQFTANPLVRNILGQPKSSFDLREIMDQKKIIIVNLSKGRVGEGNANLIGSMLITKIYLAAMSRADKNESELTKLPNFYLYVDEFQSFANKSFADILSEARKYKLNLTIAHQYIEQMEEEVRDAVFGNVGTMVAFRVGAFDSEVLEKEFAPTFMAVDMVNLGFAQVYLKLMIDGVSSQPFSATTMAPIAKPDINFKNAVIESSRSQFAKPRAAVEKDILDWHDAGTAREARPQPPPLSQMVPQQKLERSPQTSSQNQSNSDAEQAKQAFMKVAEELRQKERQSDRSPGRQPERQEERPREQQYKRPENNQQNNIQKEKDRKNPTSENILSLKSALASVISKPRQDGQKLEPPKPKENPRPTPVSTTTSQTKEVPEDVLRDLLK